MGRNEKDLLRRCLDALKLCHGAIIEAVATEDGLDGIDGQNIVTGTVEPLLTEGAIVFDPWCSSDENWTDNHGEEKT